MAALGAPGAGSGPQGSRMGRHLSVICFGLCLVSPVKDELSLWGGEEGRQFHFLFLLVPSTPDGKIPEKAALVAAWPLCHPGTLFRGQWNGTLWPSGDSG